ncbi:hypothetical protein D3C77_556570 [compost metagenome]
MSREKALELDDFPDVQAPAQTIERQKPRESISPDRRDSITPQPVAAGTSQPQFDPAAYDMADLDEDVHLIEQLGSGLDDFSEVDALLQEAQELSAQRSHPRMG